MNQKTVSALPFLRFFISSFLFLAFLLFFLSSCGAMRGMGEGCPSQNIAPAKASYRGR
ncbi:MAG: hypothetical protein JWP69_2346 [Flaviaesturariibacter sp.]|nr:hypothetical protein [Flaviaesturariibacter sp.]